MNCNTCGGYKSYSGGCNGEWECNNSKCGKEDPQEKTMSDEILVNKVTLRNLAQHAADTSAMFMPLSGFAMIGAAMIAKQAGDLLGEDIQPSEKAYIGTVNMVNMISKEFKDTVDKLSKENEELRMKLAMMPIEIEDDPEERKEMGL